MKRITEEIDGVDVFTYDTDLLAEAHRLTRPELYELAKGRRYRGISGLRKPELAIIYADTLTSERDEQRATAYIAAERAEIEEAHAEALDANADVDNMAGCHDTEGCTGVAQHSGSCRVLADEIPALLCPHGIDSRRRCSICAEDTAEGVPPVLTPVKYGHEMCLGDFGAYGACVLQRGHASAKCRDAHGHEFTATEGTRRPAQGDQRARCARKLTAHDGSETAYACGLYLNADGVCPDVNHRTVPHLLHVRHVCGDNVYVFEGLQARSNRVFLRNPGGLWNVSARDFTENYVACDEHGTPQPRPAVAWKQTYLVHVLTGQRYKVLGMREYGALFLAHDCGTPCSQELYAVSEYKLEKEFRAICEHGNGPRELCEGCGEIDENGDQISVDYAGFNAKLITEAAEARTLVGKYQEALMYTAGRLRSLAENVEHFVRENR